MTEAILHLLVPLVILRIISFFYNLDKKLIIILSTLSIIPDIDFFVFWHRATFHNLFFGAFLVVLAFVFLGKYFGKLKVAVISSFFFLSHLFLDSAFIDWFYPFEKVHYQLFTGATSSLEAMNAAKPHYSLTFSLIEISVVLGIYLILIYEAYIYKRNAKDNKI